MRFIYILLFSFLFFDGICQLDSGLTFGGINNDIGTSICNTDNDGLLIVGSTRSFGAGSEDIYSILLDSKFNIIWTKTYGYVHSDNIRKVISIPDGYILAGDVWDIGMARTELYIQKISRDGDLLWRKGFGTHYNERGFDILHSSDNYFYLLGYSRGYDLKGDIFMVKTDTSGNEIWRNTYGFDNDDYAMDIVENENNDIVIVGTKNGFFTDVHANYAKHDADIVMLTIDSSGQELSNSIIGGSEHDFGYGILNAEDDTYYISGSSQTFSNGKFDMFLAQTDNSGNIIWQNNFGGQNYEYCVSMCYGSIDELYLVGTSKSYSSSADIYVVKTDLSGNEIWSLAIGGPYIDNGNSIIPTEDGGCYVVGNTQNESGFSDMLLLKINKDGIIQDLTGTDTSFSPDLSIGPNPMSNSTNFILSETKEYFVRITDINGIVIRSFNINYGKTPFYREGLSAGLYIYAIFDSSGNNLVLTGKLIIH